MRLSVGVYYIVCGTVQKCQLEFFLMLEGETNIYVLVVEIV